jgi:hypothetical protein
MQELDSASHYQYRAVHGLRITGTLFSQGLHKAPELSHEDYSTLIYLGLAPENAREFFRGPGAVNRGAGRLSPGLKREEKHCLQTEEVIKTRS